MLRAGLYRDITVEHLLVVEGDGEAIVVTYDKYKNEYMEHPHENYETVEAALDAMFEATNTLSPRWPIEYIPRQARFLRALCDDPEDPTFSTLGRVGESITLTAAVDLFKEQEINLISMEELQAEVLKVSPFAYIRRILDTPVSELFDVTRPDSRESESGPHPSRVDPSESEPPDRRVARDHAQVRGPEGHQGTANDPAGGLGIAAAESGEASELHPDTEDSADRGLTAAVDIDGYEVFEWPEPHRL